jgi:hypothetical protein
MHSRQPATPQHGPGLKLSDPLQSPPQLRLCLGKLSAQRNHQRREYLIWRRTLISGQARTLQSSTPGCRRQTGTSTRHQAAAAIRHDDRTMMQTDAGDRIGGNGIVRTGM